MMQLANPCKISATYTESFAGCVANSSALAMIARMPHAAAMRLLRIASTKAPAGIWLSIAVMVPRVSAKPISTWVHLFAVR